MDASWKRLQCICVFECVSGRTDYKMQVDGEAWQLSGSGSSCSSLFSSSVCFSGDGKMLCCANRERIEFHGANGMKSKSPGLESGEICTYVATIKGDPWIVCAGTSHGNLIFFTLQKILFKYHAHSEKVIYLKVCSFKESHFTKRVNKLYVQFSRNVGMEIDLDENGFDDPDRIRRLRPEDFKFNKWTFDHKDSVDKVIVNSTLESPIFAGLHQFPAVLSVGSEPFISVDSIAEKQQQGATELVKKAATKLFRMAASWLGAAEEPKEEEVIPKARHEWELNDEGRVARNCLASERGRWLAITDTQGRVSIVDCVFGHITRVMKGLRDAQIAWYHELLLVFAPARGVMFACTVPSGEIIEAAKVDKNGKLFQRMGTDDSMLPVFVDSKGFVADLKCRVPEPAPREEITTENLHFQLPE